MIGAVGRAPCGHQGEAVVGNYFRCVSCDSYATRPDDHLECNWCENTESAPFSEFDRCPICAFGDLIERDAVPEPIEDEPTAPHCAKHGVGRYTRGGVTRCVFCDGPL